MNTVLFYYCSILILLVFWTQRSSAHSADCEPTTQSACNESCYSEIPDSIIYAEIGDSFNVTIEHTEVFSFNLYNTTSGSDVFCDPDVCVVHDRRLEIKRFQPYLEGNYEFRFNYSMLGEFCAVNFTLKRALSCPKCYEEVSFNYNQSLIQLEELVNKINQSLNTSEVDDELSDLLSQTHISLLELLELVKNLSLREIQLKLNIDDVIVQITEKEDDIELFSQFIRQSEGNSMAAEDNINMIDGDISRLIEESEDVRMKLQLAQQNITDALVIVGNIIRIRDQLSNITNTSDSISREQEEIVKNLLRQARILSDNATEALANVCEAVDIENSTLYHLQGIRNCTLVSLDLLLLEAQTLLQYAVRNATRVLQDSFMVYNRVLNITIPDFNANTLITESEELIEEAEDLRIEVDILTNETESQRIEFDTINSTVHYLLSRAIMLNNTASELISRAMIALSLANTSVEEGDAVIRDLESLLDELQIRFQELESFLADYYRLLAVVERAENISGIAINESTRQAEEITRIVPVIVNINVTLQTAVENLDLAMNIINNASNTAGMALLNAESLTNSLQDFPQQVGEANNSILALQERAEKDRLAIGVAESQAMAASNEADSLEDRVGTITRLLNNLEELVRNATLVSESEFTRLSSLLNELEVTIMNIESDLNDIANDINNLEKQSLTLEDKYVDLQRHRDLLEDIRSNIAELDCEPQFE